MLLFTLHLIILNKERQLIEMFQVYFNVVIGFRLVLQVAPKTVTCNVQLTAFICIFIEHIKVEIAVLNEVVIFVSKT